MSGHGSDKPALPGSHGEHALQTEFGSDKRALAFYNNQMLDVLNPAMQDFIARQTLMFIASADARGECDCSFRAGEPGFVRVVDERHILWAEYRGNGVMASGGNVRENPHMGVLLMDFDQTIGLHINGKAHLLQDGAFTELSDDLRRYVLKENASSGGKRPAFWFLLEVEEAYIHCAKHIPRMVLADKVIDWGTDDDVKKGGDYFGVRAARARRAP